VIVITAGVPNRTDIESRDVFLEGNLKLMKLFGTEIKQYAPDALIITASNPVDSLNYYLYKEFDFRKEQLLGYSLNDSLRFERSLRSVMQVDRNKELFTPVIGEHGSTQVPLFSLITMDGENMRLNEADRSKIKDKNDRWFIEFN